MNNFELDKRATELADTTTHYELARALLCAAELLVEAKESVGEDSEMTL